MQKKKSGVKKCLEICAIKGGGGRTPNGKCHLKFPFWLCDYFPYTGYRRNQEQVTGKKEGHQTKCTIWSDFVLMIGSIAMIGFRKSYHIKKTKVGYLLHTVFVLYFVSVDITSTGNSWGLIIYQCSDQARIGPLLELISNMTIINCCHCCLKLFQPLKVLTIELLQRKTF